MDASLDKLNKEQKEQVLRQWEEHQHNNIKVDIELSGHGEKLIDFIVHKGVWNPAIVSSRYHASYLYYNNSRLYERKDVLDIGTGTGLMGVVMGLFGARSVVMSDISKPATKNAKANIEKFKLTEKTKVIQGDLFENISKTFDFIVFNHPFFGDVPPTGDTIAASMLAEEGVIDKFLKEAPRYLKPDGVIMMPYYTKAGETNDPTIQGPKHSYIVVNTFKSISGSGLQTGEISIHELKVNPNSKK